MSRTMSSLVVVVPLAPGDVEQLDLTLNGKHRRAQLVLRRIEEVALQLVQARAAGEPLRVPARGFACSRGNRSVVGEGDRAHVRHRRQTSALRRRRRGPRSAPPGRASARRWRACHPSRAAPHDPRSTRRPASRRPCRACPAHGCACGETRSRASCTPWRSPTRRQSRRRRRAPRPGAVRCRRSSWSARAIPPADVPPIRRCARCSRRSVRACD